jgi:hypothetical protein
MSYYHSRFATEINRLPSGLFFRADQSEKVELPQDIFNEVVNHEINYQNFVVPEYRSTKDGTEVYLPLLEVSVRGRRCSDHCVVKTDPNLHEPIKEAH